MGDMKFIFINLNHGNNQYNIKNKFFFLIDDSLWKHFISTTGGIIFLLDLTDSIHVNERKQALNVCISFFLP